MIDNGLHVHSTAQSKSDLSQSTENKTASLDNSIGPEAGIANDLKEKSECSTHSLTDTELDDLPIPNDTVDNDADDSNNCNENKYVCNNNNRSPRSGAVALEALHICDEGTTNGVTRQDHDVEHLSRAVSEHPRAHSMSAVTRRPPGLNNQCSKAISFTSATNRTSFS